MADFCQQCSIRFFGEDFRDLAIGDDREGVKETERFIVQCEGCGLTDALEVYTVVDRDGRCTVDCSEHHGRETVEDWPLAEALPS